MNYLKYIFVLFLAITTLPAFSQTDTVYTLQQCIDIAIKNNLDVRKSELDMERDRVYWNQARENLLPTVNGNVQHTISNGRSQDPTTYNYVNQQIKFAQYNLNSNLILFNGMNLMNTIKQYSLSYQAGKLSYQQAKDDITLNVISTYLQVLDNQELLNQTATQVEVSKQQVDRLKILDKSGNISPSQLSDLRGQLASDQLNLIDARNAMYAAKLNLMQLMNVPFNREAKIQPIPADQLPGQYTQNADQVYQTALNGLPLVKAAELRYRSSAKAVSAARGALYPTLALGGGWGTNYSSTGNTNYGSQLRNNYNTNFTLGLSIPILNYWRNRNNVSLAKINMLEAQATNENTKVLLRKNVEQAYVNMTSAYERYQTLTEQVDAFSESFRVAEVKFNSGVLNSVEFIVIKGNMDRAKLNLISARYDYFIRAKILDYYQGKLTL
ncbi:TolC family protein [Mucilaginibacter sp. RS28]|uniref:TolC family protein n=1 Tax=Mucilaginibacter straminoryzae TaxID=2932774 RepID=A0A9X2BAY0_9SPHI|nr:TolC family protein [Mucilaginibacter straminoryzae]MCJ8211245.1 TolC family protein [Mucilaginibacter straminoryzae]